jgi:MFS family permease
VILAAPLLVAIAVLDVTSVAVLLPTIRLDLGSSTSGGQWVLNAYLLALAAPLPALARLAPPRHVLIGAGALAMAAGAVVCATADSTAVAVAGQSATGAGTAALLASIDPRPARFSLPALVLPLLALALGPVIGGELGERNWWHVFFWAGVPLAALAAAAALLAPAAPRRPHPAGLAPALALGAGLVALTIVLVQSEPWGVGSPEVVAALAVVAGSLLATAGARRLGLPRSVWAAAAGAVAALCFLLPQYFELAHLIHPLRSGARLSILTTAAVAGGVAAWRLRSTIHPQALAVAGSIVAVAGLVALGSIDPKTGNALVGAGLVLAGGGFGLAAGAAYDGRVGDLLAAAATGAALSLALAGALFQQVQADQRADGKVFEDALTRGVGAGTLILVVAASAIAAGSLWLGGRLEIRPKPASSAARPAAES